MNPLSVCIHKLFKGNLKWQWNTEILENDKTIIKRDQIYHGGLEILCKWIIKAWIEMKFDIIQKSF